jgi:hypothetical protein
MASKGATALKVARLPDILELHRLISLNMVECHSNRDPNRPDRWLTSSLQPSMEGNKAVMVDHLNNHLLDTVASNRWAVMEAPLVLADMAVVNSLQQHNSGRNRLLLKGSLVVTPDTRHKF